LNLKGAVGQISEYERLSSRLDDEYRATASQQLLGSENKAVILEHRASLRDTQSGADVILNAILKTGKRPIVSMAFTRREGNTPPNSM
jgi:hypothetical protein